MSRPMRTLSRIAVVAVSILLHSSAQAGGTDEQPEPSRFLDALETAIGSIRSFDVHVLVRTEYYFTERISDSVRFKRGLIVFAQPRIEQSRSRQVFQNSWRRIEKLDTQTGKAFEVVGADNEIERVLYSASQRGSIRRAGGRGIDWGSDYQETFRTLCAEMPIVAIFRERIDSVGVRRDGRYVVLEVDPMPASFGAWGFRVYCDTSANLLPAKTETFHVRDGERQLLSRITVTERKKIAPGVEVPVKAMTEGFSVVKDYGKFQQVNQKIELTVDVARSRWNEPLADEAFRVPFPAGTHVVDQIRDVAFVVGKTDPGGNLEDLAKHARGLITNVRYEPPRESRAWLWWAGAGVGGVTLAIGAYLFYRRYCARATI